MMSSRIRSGGLSPRTILSALLAVVGDLDLVEVLEQAAHQRQVVRRVVDHQHGCFSRKSSAGSVMDASVVAFRRGFTAATGSRSLFSRNRAQLSDGVTDRFRHADLLRPGERLSSLLPARLSIEKSLNLIHRGTSFRTSAKRRKSRDFPRVARSPGAHRSGRVHAAARAPRRELASCRGVRLAADCGSSWRSAGRRSSSRPSCRRPSSPWPAPRRAPCRACRCATRGRRPTRARRRVVDDRARSAGRLPAVVHCSICRSPSELPNAAIGRRPMCCWMPTGLPVLVVDEVRPPAACTSTGLPSRSSNFVLPLLPTTCSGGMP